MSLIIMDGFDWLGATGIAGLDGKWDVGANRANVAGRNSGRAVSTSGNSSAGSLTYSIPAAMQHNTLIIGGYLTTGNANKFILYTTHISVEWLSTGAIRVNGPGGVLGTSAAGLWGTFTAKFIEVKVFSHNTLGTVTVKVTGTAVLTITGADTQSGGSDLNTGVTFNLHSGDGTQRMTWDDVYVLSGAGSAPLNDWLGDCTIPAFLPNGNGATSGWVGSDADSTDNYLLVDEQPASMTDYVEASVVGTKDTYAFANLGAGTPVAVDVIAYALRTDTVEAKQLAAVARSSGGTEATGTARAVPAGTADTTVGVFETEPGGAAWTLTSLNAAEFGVKVAV